jgi:hypothetical protein
VLFPVTRDALLEAMERYDRDWRTDPRRQGWKENEASRYEYRAETETGGGRLKSRPSVGGDCAGSLAIIITRCLAGRRHRRPRRREVGARETDRPIRRPEPTAASVCAEPVGGK